MSNWETAVSKKSPMGWWRYSTYSGLSMPDISGNGRDMILASSLGSAPSLIPTDPNGATDAPNVAAQAYLFGAQCDLIKGWGIWLKQRSQAVSTFGRTDSGNHDGLGQFGTAGNASMFYWNGAASVSVTSQNNIFALNEVVFWSWDWDGQVGTLYKNGIPILRVPQTVYRTYGAGGFFLMPWAVGSIDAVLDDVVAFDHALGDQGWLDLYQAGANTPEVIVRASKQTPALVHTFDLWNGTKLRSSPNERDVLGVAKSFTFSTDEHGYAQGDIVLPRPDNWDPMDGALLANLKTTDQAGRDVYEARVVGKPRTGVNEITVQLEGWSKHGDDDESASMIFRDIDLSHWGPISAKRRINMGAGQVPIDGQLVPDATTGVPALDHTMDSPWAAALTILSDYDAGAANRIAAIYWAYKVIAGIGAADANWAMQVKLSDDDLFSSVDSFTTTPPGASASGTLLATKPTRRFAELQTGYNTNNATTNTHVDNEWVGPAVYGAHGLTKRGSEPNAGFYISDMIPYIAGRWCPRWNIRPDSIELSSFIMPHADFRDSQMTAGKMLDGLVPYGGNSNVPMDWFVYGDRTLYVMSDGNYGRTYRIRRESGAESLDQGPDVSLMMNGVLVTFNPGDGTSLRVGPPNSGADIETQTLAWADPNHPATRAGIRQWKTVDAQIMNAPGAVLLGQLAMTQRNNQPWRGSITARGNVTDAAGNPVPPYMIKALERTILSDDPDLRSRRIVGTTYTDKTRSTEVQIGSPPDRIDSYLAKAGVLIKGQI